MFISIWGFSVVNPHKSIQINKYHIHLLPMYAGKPLWLKWWALDLLSAHRFYHFFIIQHWKMALNLATYVFFFGSLVVQVVCDSFPGPWPLYQNHICPSASSELVIEFLGHDIYQDLDCSLVLRLISTTQPRNIPHTIKNSILLNV